MLFRSTTPAIIHGDAGNDHLQGGGGATVLVGGSGDDTLNGQSGRDILIGGTGNDRLVGGSGDDVLIGGRTTFDHNQDAALSNAAQIWSDPLDSYQDRATALDAFLTVIDDGDADTLTGAAGNDLFYAGTADVATDQKAAELNSSALALMAMTAAHAPQGGVSEPKIDWTASGWSAGVATAPAPAAAGDWVTDFLLLTGPSSKAQERRNT